jgi:hypothetical protein
LRAQLFIAGAFAAAMLSGGAAWAHHSFAAEFDSTQSIEVTGVVTKVEWRNPHTYFYVDVADESGAVHNWGMELGSPNGLARRGWRPDSLKAGDTVSVEGMRARDGSYKANARSVVLSTGERLFSVQTADAPASRFEGQQPASN